MNIPIQTFMTRRCHARCFSHASYPWDEWPTTGSWHPGEKQHPRLSTLNPWECPYTGGGFPYAIVQRTTLPKPVDWLPVTSLCQIADTVANAVTFLRLALRQTTRTLFRFQGTTHLFSQGGQKVETPRRQGLKPETLTTASEAAWLARAKASFVVRNIWQKLSSFEHKKMLIVTHYWQLFSQIFGETVLRFVNM
jgi:hypothetical protein